MEEPPAGGAAAGAADSDGFYLVTAQRPTAVTHSVVGNFCSPNEVDLLLA